MSVTFIHFQITRASFTLPNMAGNTKKQFYICSVCVGKNMLEALKQKEFVGNYFLKSMPHGGLLD
jgi:hypothetical protein